MIENIEGYKLYLRDERGLADGTVNSYPTYLSAITNHLDIDITSDTVCSSKAVTEILEELKLSLKEKNYWGNCQSALKAYFEFVELGSKANRFLSENEIKLLHYLVLHIQSSAFAPKNPLTHLPYSKVLNDLELPNDGRTPGDSLNRHAMGGLAKWLFNNKFPAITGVIINKQNHPDRPLLPSKTYFEYHSREDMDFTWQRGQIESACRFDWHEKLESLGISLFADFSYAEEVTSPLKEGASKSITVNAYERNPEARNVVVKKNWPPVYSHSNIFALRYLDSYHRCAGVA